MYCWKLGKAILSDKLLHIDELAFLSCPELIMTVPNSVEIIGPGAFAKCDNGKIEILHQPYSDAWFE